MNFNKEKWEVFENLLSKGGIIMVHLDPRLENVFVPEKFYKDSSLRLNISHNFNLPTLEMGEEGIAVTLSFGGINNDCFLPWESIYAMTDPNDIIAPVVWVDSIPPELKVLAPDGDRISKERKLVAISGGNITSEPKRGHLSLVKNDP